MRNLFHIGILALLAMASAEQGYYQYNNDDANNYQNYDANGAEDAADRYYYANMHQDDTTFSAGDDYIKYWTDYALLPKRCIV